MIKSKLLLISSVIFVDGCIFESNTTSESVTNGSIIDKFTYEGQTYRTVQIGSTIWMAENLNYVPKNGDSSGIYCYDNSELNCDKYGRLYEWSIAMQLPDSCSNSDCLSMISLNHQGICPQGWHVARDSDWSNLQIALETHTATQLKTQAPDWDGRNSSGFRAIPAGFRTSTGQYYRLTEEANFWSANQNLKRNAWYAKIIKGDGELMRNQTLKTEALSVRCVKNK